MSTHGQIFLPANPRGFKMAAEKSDLESRRQQKSESQSQDGEYENYGDEPDFSDSEDFEDDITDEG